MNPRNLYGGFLITKGALNLGAAGAAYFLLRDNNMAGFWLALAAADLWLGVCSIE